MTITPAGRHKGRYELPLPGTQYIGIRLKKSADQSDEQENNNTAENE